MTARTTTFLGWATLGAILAAIWLAFGEDPSGHQGGRGEKLIPGLGTLSVNDVLEVRIAKGADTVTLTPDAAGWRFAEKDGFRISSERVEALLKSLARSTRREPKTTSKDRFHRIGLGAEDAITLKLITEKGAVADILIGTRREGAEGRSLTYVYKAGDTRAWLVSDIPALGLALTDWANTDLLSFSGDRIKAINGPAWHLARPSEGAPFNLEDGTLPNDDMSGEAIARRLGQMRYDDVRSVLNPLSDPLGVLHLTTFEDTELDIIVYRLEGEYWLSLKPVFHAVGGWLFHINEADGTYLEALFASEGKENHKDSVAGS